MLDIQDTARNVQRAYAVLSDIRVWYLLVWSFLLCCARGYKHEAFIRASRIPIILKITAAAPRRHSSGKCKGLLLIWAMVIASGGDFGARLIISRAFTHMRNGQYGVPFGFGFEM